MRYAIAILIIASVLFAGIAPGTFYTGPHRVNDTFDIENRVVKIINIYARGSFTGGLCKTSSSSYALIKHPTGIGSGTTTSNLSRFEDVDFSIKETETGLSIPINMEVSNIDGYYGEFCSGLAAPSSRNVTVKLAIAPETYYCNDPDATGLPLPQTVAGYATAKKIVPEDVRGDITFFVLAQSGVDPETHTISDVCINATTVKERTCNADNEVSSQIINCNSMSVCANNRCVVGDIVCNDGDGADTTTAGTVTISRQKEGIGRVTATYTDSCVDSNTAREFSCSGTSVVNTTIACPAGYNCAGTKCIPAGDIVFCTDSDGNSISTKGTSRSGTRNAATLVETSGNDEQDGCVNSDTVREYVCEGDNRIARERDCSDGQICSDGKCISEPEATAPPYCSDTDGGIDTSKKGTVEYGVEDLVTIQNDECVSETTLLEYYCESALGRGTTITCAADQICKEGKCVTKEAKPPKPPPTPPPTPPIEEAIKKLAEDRIKEANEAIIIASQANKNVDNAKIKLVQAQAAFDNDNYEKAASLADEAKKLAIQAKEIEAKPQMAIDQNILMMIGAAVIIIILILLYLKTRKNQEKLKPPEPAK